MTPERAREVALRFITFLETGSPPPGLFATGVLCDFTMPTWRVRAPGVDGVVALRKEGHPGLGSVACWRCDPTPIGFVLEFEERWEQDGTEWYSRELARADVDGAAITSLSVYCTGDWGPAWRAAPARAVTLLRP